jgi:uncharacterized protein involved in exopolysaccharide biosynthesis
MSVPTANRLSRYLMVILRWLLVLSVVFVLTMLAGKYVTDNFLSKVYTATAQIQVQPRVDDFVGSFAPPAPTIGDEIEIMKSPEFLLPLIYDLGLDKAWAQRVDTLGLDVVPSQDALLPLDALAYMNKILKLKLARRTNIIDITVSSDVPMEAARIANAIAARYKNMHDAEEDQRNNRGIISLRDQIAQQQKVVDEKKAIRDKLREELERYPIVISGPEPPLSKVPTALLQSFRDAQRDLEQQQSVLDALNVRLKQDIADSQLQEGPVRIISRAEVPMEPSKPNKNFAFIVTIVAAGVLSVMAASFVEVILLFLRAAEKPDN